MSAAVSPSSPVHLSSSARARRLLAALLVALLAVSLVPAGAAPARAQDAVADEVVTTRFAEPEQQVGQPPAGWTSRWNAGDFRIADGPRRLVHTPSDQGQQILTWDAVADVPMTADAEVAAVVRVPSGTTSTSATKFQLHLGASGPEVNSMYVDAQDTTLRLGRYQTGTYVARGNGSYTMERDTWYQVVFQRRGGVWRAKAWPHGTPEPATWVFERPITALDEALPAGRVGIGHFSEGAVTEWAWVSAATGASDAQRAPADLFDPPVDDGVHTTRFNEPGQTVGQPPVGWTPGWGGGDFRIADNPRRLVHTADGGYELLTFDAAGEVPLTEDAEVAAVLRVPAASAPTGTSTLFQLHLAASGEEGAEWSMYTDAQTSTVRLGRYRNGGATGWVLRGSASYTMARDTWYQVVLQRRDGVWRIKIWPHGTEEPAGWLLERDITDLDLTLPPGRVGVGHFGAGAITEWAWVSAAAGDDRNAQRAPDDLFGEPEPDQDVFSTSFTEAGQQVGQPPVGWTSRWYPGDFRIADEPRRLVHTAGSAGHQVLTFDAAGELPIEADAEVAALLRVPHDSAPSGTTTKFQLHLAASGSAGSEWSMYADHQGSTIRLGRYRGSGTSAYTLRGSETLEFLPGVWYHVVAQRAGGTWRAKAWQYGTPEPATWAIEREITDLDRTLPQGGFGVGHFGAGAINEWAWFSVGKNGASAQRAPAGLIDVDGPSEPVTGVTVTQRDGFATVRWEALDKAETYDIQRTPVDADGNPTGPGEIVGVWRPDRYRSGTLSFADAGFQPGDRFAWRVRGVGSGVPGPWSAPVVGATREIFGPDAYRTGLETSAAASWTSYAEEIAFTKALAEGSPRVRYEKIAETIQGRDLNLIVIGDPPGTAEEIAAGDSVLIACGVHGPEPSAREACMLLARDLAFSTDPAVTDFLEDTTVLIVPNLSPDGRANNTRGNANGVNLNRDHLLLEENETFGFAGVLRDYKPDLIVDGHEYSSSTTSDLVPVWPRHHNVHQSVYELSQDGLLLGHLFPRGAEDGWWNAPYPVATLPQDGVLSNVLGLKNSVGMLVEARLGAGPTRPAEGASHSPANKLRKTFSQLWAYREALDYYRDNRAAVKEAIAESTAAAVANEGPVYLDGMREHPAEYPVNVPAPTRILDPAPCGYLVDGAAFDEQVGAVRSVRERFDRHGIAYERLDDGRVLVRLAQPLRAMIPLLLDPFGETPMLVGQRVADCDNLPPVPTGEVFSTDFSDATVGTVPDGWTSRWNPSDFRIADGPRRLVHTSTGGGRKILTWDEPGIIDGDVEVAALVRTPSPRPVTRFQLHLAAMGDANSIESYYLDVYNDTIRINQNVGGTFSVGTTAAYSGFQEDRWHHVVFQRRGAVLRGKIWPYGQPEPAGWMVQHTDARLGGGRVGVGYAPTAGVVNDWAWVSVGTGPESAQRAPADLIPMPQKPDQVDDLAGQARYGGILLTWGDDEHADRWEIERDGVLIADAWKSPSYTDALIAPGATGTYRVRGVNSIEGAGEWSAPVTVTAEALHPTLALPFETTTGAQWTSHAAELAFTAALAEASPRVAVTEIGRSGQGRRIELVRVGLNAPPTDEEIDARPTILIGCTQHGNEPAPREACLATLRELAFSSSPEVLSVLERYVVLVMPTMNPDGRAADVRALPTLGKDPNRDHVELEAPESRAVAAVLADHTPDLVLDAHEFVLEPAGRGELEVQAAGNLNAHPALLDLSEELAFDSIMGNAPLTGGATSAVYGTQTETAGILRNTAALKGAVSVLVESRIPASELRLEEQGLGNNAPQVRRRRVAGQRFALAETLRYAAANVDAITAASAAAAAAAQANEGPLYTGGSRASAPSAGQVLDPPPCGWLTWLADVEKNAELLDAHGVGWQTVSTSIGEMAFIPAGQAGRAMAVTLVDPGSEDAVLAALRATDCPVRPATFEAIRVELDRAAAAGAVPASTEGKVRHALDTAEAWLALPNKLGPALSHLDRAASLLLWQADVIDRGANPGDAVWLRAIADQILRLRATFD